MGSVLTIVWLSVYYRMRFSRLIDWLSKKIEQLVVWIKRKRIAKKQIHIFDKTYINTNAFYLREYNRVPCVTFISNVDVKAICESIISGRAGSVLATYQKADYNWQRQRREFSRKLFILNGKMLIEVGTDWVEILFDNTNYSFANTLADEFVQCKSSKSNESAQINIITQSNGYLELKQMNIKPSNLDIGLFYNDDFAEVDAIIKERLSKEDDKGIVLLHGLPGTGKTTYLRHLIGGLKKKVLFVSPSVAGNLMNPEFIDLLIDNPNAILVIEDAENIIMDRKYSSNSSVSNLLNISDGLLSDCLNVQIICTFNSALNLVDSALLRKGRLIAKYEFGKLSTDKSQSLSNHLGLDQLIVKPQTLAEITNPNQLHFETPQVNVIGFRREMVMAN